METIRVLSPSQMEMIDQAAQAILERTGMVIRSAEARGLLRKAGCSVDDASCLVKFPRKVTQQAVAKMKRDFAAREEPNRMPVRFSHVRFRRTQHQVHQDFTVSAGGFVPFIY